MQLNPLQNYTIVRQLDNAADTATYYVQSVIRYSSTGKTYKTINLTNKGSQRFIGSFTTPADTGNGTQIDITTSVYTDSGYSSLSPVYSTTIEQHLVQLLFNPAFGSGGGISGTEYAKFEEILAKHIKGIKFPEFPTEAGMGKEFSKLSPGLQEILGHLKAMKGGFEDSKKFVQELNDRKETKSREIIGGFSESLAGTKKELNIILNDHSYKLTKNIFDILSKYNEYHSSKIDALIKIIEEIAGHFNALIKDKNEFVKKQTKSLINRIKDSIGDINEIRPDSMIEIKSQEDYSPRIKKLLESR